MRKRLRRPRADIETVARQGRPVVMRALAGLLSLALFLQVAVLHHQHPHGASPRDAKAIALAELGAAIGQTAAICAHDEDSSDRDGGGALLVCQHCAFCHSIAVGFASPPVSQAALVRIASTSGTGPERDDAAAALRRVTGSATPRGPPPLG